MAKYCEICGGKISSGTLCRKCWLSKTQKEIITTKNINERQISLLNRESKDFLINLYSSVYKAFESDGKLDDDELSTLNRIQRAFSLSNTDVLYEERMKPYVSSIDSKELQGCLAYFEAMNNVIALQSKEADLFNNAMVKYGNSIMDKGPVAADDMKKATRRHSEAATEILKRHGEIKNVPLTASTMHSAWRAAFSANAVWASAMVEALESNMFALLEMAKGMNSQIEYAQRLAKENHEAFRRAEDEYKRLLGRLKVGEDVKDFITAHATKMDATDDWKPEIDPNDIETHLRLAGVYEDEDRFDEAIKEYQELIRLEPSLAAEAHFRLGVIYSDFLGRLDDAIREFKESLIADPNDSAAHDRLGMAYADAGRLNEAIIEYEEALRLCPDDEGNQSALGSLYNKRGEGLNPNDARAHYCLGLFYEKEGRFEEAKRCYQKVIKLAPLEPWYSLAKEAMEHSSRLKGGFNLKREFNEENRNWLQSFVMIYNQACPLFDTITKLNNEGQPVNPGSLLRGYSELLNISLAIKDMPKPSDKELRKVKADFERTLSMCIKAGEMATKMLDDVDHGAKLAARMHVASIVGYVNYATIYYKELLNRLAKIGVS